MAFKKLYLATTLLALAGAPYSSWAQSLRCGGDLVKIGDSKASVLQKCGEPALKDSFCSPAEAHSLNSSSQTTTAVVPCESADDWTYAPGRGQFLTTVKFHRGVVTEITYGDRVK